jgi:hypothetical protein
MFALVGQAGPGADQAHLAAQYIDELGKLIQAQAAQEATAGDQTFVGAIQLGHRAVGSHQILQVALVNQSVGIDRHRPEFVTTEQAASKPDSILRKQDWARGDQLDGKGYQHAYREQERRARQNESGVQYSFP